MNDSKSRPHPHEDVTGVDRDDWLLELDTQALTHRDGLAAMAYLFHRATMVGNPAPIVAQMWERISQPQVGDLVIEATYWFPNRDEDHRLKSLGLLVARREEWACSDEEWARWEAEDPEAYDGERPVERDAWYIQYGSKSGDICRWTNCTFLVAPIDRKAFLP